MNIKPRRGTVMIRTISKHKKYKSIWLASTKKEVFDSGEIIAVGNPPHDKRGERMFWPYEVGEKVYYKRYSGKKFRDPDDQYKMRIFLDHTHIIARENDAGIHAVGDMLLLKIKYAETEGTIIIPDQAKQYNAGFVGEIVSISPEYKYKHEVKMGDKIHFLRHEGYAVNADNETYLAMKDKWIGGKE